MNEELPDTSPLDLGDGRTVLFDEPTDGIYRVRMPNGEVQAFPARGVASRENAVADIITNPPVVIPPVPVEVPAWRIRAVVELNGLSQVVDAAFAGLSLSARVVASQAWQGNVIRRDSIIVNQMASSLGLTSEQVDTIFRQADSIQV